jgi:hypothetical protein
MRYLVTAVVIATLAAIFLISRYPGDAGPNEIPTGREVAPVKMPLETDLPIADQEDLQATTPDQVSAESTAEPIASRAARDAAMQTSVIEFDPDQRDKIVTFLSKRGLAVVDSERIADSALNATKECIRQAFGSNDATGARIETCMFNVLAANGLNEIAGTD